MAFYVLLANFTDQGVRSVRDSPKRAEAFKAAAEKRGAKVHSLYWTLGRYDVVSIFEADDDVEATSLTLSVAELGNVKTQTLRAFDIADMQKIISKMA